MVLLIILNTPGWPARGRGGERDTQIGVGIDPGVTQAVSAASGVWDPQSGQLMADQLRRWKLTKGQVKHDSSLNNGRRDTQRWLAPIKPHLQHLAAASSAGTSLEANLKHITVTLATWDAVWEVYLDPKWARQRLRLYGAQDRALEQFFNTLEEDMAEVSMERNERAKQLVVFFGAASIGTGGGWGADAVLRACCKVVCMPRGAGQRRGRVVLVDEHRTTQTGSPPEGQVEHRLVRPAWSQQRGQPVRGLMWCPVVATRKPPQAPRSILEASQPAASEPGPSTPPPAKRSKPAAEPTKGKGKAAKAKPAPQPGRWLDRDCNAALNMQRIGESRWRPLELCYWPDQGALPDKGKEHPGLATSGLVKAMGDKKSGLKARCAGAQKAREVMARRRAAEAEAKAQAGAAEAEAPAQADVGAYEAQLHQLQADLQQREQQVDDTQRLQHLQQQLQDLQQDELQRKEQQVAEQQQQLQQQQADMHLREKQVAEQQHQVQQRELQVAQQLHQVQQQQADMQQREQQVAQQQHQVQQQQADMRQREQQVAQQQHQVQQQQADMQQREQQVAQQQHQVQQQQADMQQREQQVAQQQHQVQLQQADMQQREQQVAQQQHQVQQQQADMQQREQQVAQQQHQVQQQQADMQQREQQVAQQQHQVQLQQQLHRLQQQLEKEWREQMLVHPELVGKVCGAAVLTDTSASHRQRGHIMRRRYLVLDDARQAAVCCMSEADVERMHKDVKGCRAMHRMVFTPDGDQPQWAMAGCACNTCMSVPCLPCMKPDTTTPLEPMPMFQDTVKEVREDEECYALLMLFHSDLLHDEVCFGKLTNKHCERYRMHMGWKREEGRRELRRWVLRELQSEELEAEYEADN
ncbi:hypothetical protein QJQ45_011844 [Haematococcus lacustris]|nr:hypothetical protein QJQ45_011844 [Haematococcus lacustris]